MRELTVAEQRYNAVHAVLFDGRTITDVAAASGISRQSLHTWLARYEAGGIDALANRTSRPRTNPIQMPTHVEAAMIQLDHQRAPTTAPGARAASSTSCAPAPWSHQQTCRVSQGSTAPSNAPP
jgi:transposase-like protein